MADPSAVVHLVAHTHWDREWYHPAARFRQHLVRLVDELLDAPADACGTFLLDGQTVVLDDYLAVRPERRAELAARLREGMLEAGPWYVLADELIPAGESLVRNLLAGRRALQALGAASPPVLYSPDAFGHTAALPLLAAGFGLALIVVWRGFGGRRWPEGDTFRWRAADGTERLLYHLPRSGYELGSNLPYDDAAARARWARMCEELEPRSTLGVLLVQNGADHHALQRHQQAAVRALTDAAAPIPVVRSSLSDFADTLMARAAASPQLPVVEGELRDSYGYTWTLQGTFATRASQKRRNARIERLLLREAEPLAALAARRGAAELPALLAAAWRTLLRCHPHDTLCGCSTDEVARAMEARLDSAEAQALGIRDDAVTTLLGHDPVEARSERERWRSVLVVRNAAPRTRSGVAEVRLERFVADAPVGPGSRPPVVPAAAPRAPDVPAGWPVQLVAHRREQQRVESPRHYPDNDVVDTWRALAWVDAAPPLGIAVRELESTRARGGPVVPVTGRENSIDNGLLAVAVDARGRVRLRDHHGTVDIAALLAFEDVGDRGDLYTHSPMGAPVVTAACIGARLVERGPLRGVIETRWRVLVRRAGAGRGPRTSSARTSRTAPPPLDVRVRLLLNAGSPFLRLRVRGRNVLRDHRLRIVLRTGIAQPHVVADAAFGPVAREPLRVSAAEARVELPPRTAPLHRFVSLYSAERGVTVFSDGLAEYEAMPDGRVAITLVRAVGELSRPDLPERPGNAGWPVATPEAQCIGPFAADLAIMPHGASGAATQHAIECAADDVLLPLRGETLRSALAVPDAAVGPELVGEGLALSAVKPSDDGEWLVLRCVNATDAGVTGGWRLPFVAREAWTARLDETPLGPLEVDGAWLALGVPPRGVMTLLVR